MSDMVTQQAVRSTPASPAELREPGIAPLRSPLLRYGAAVALTIVALFLTLFFSEWLGRTIFLLFWPAVVASALIGGFGPAILSAIFAVVAVNAFMIEPRGELHAPATADIATFIGFLSVAALASWAVAVAEKARSKASEAAVENARLARLLDEQGSELSLQLEESQAMQEELEQSTEELIDRTAQAEGAERFTREILESIAHPFVVYDSEWRFRYINEAASQIFRNANHGGRDEMIGRVVWDEWPEIRGGQSEREMKRAITERAPVSFEIFNAAAGTWSEIVCYPLGDGGLGVQWKDITVRKRAEESARYLAEATGVLASSLDYEATLADLARLIVPHFADWCAVSIVDDHGRPKQLAVAHVDPDKVRWAHELQNRYPPDLSARTGVPEVIRTGNAEIYSEIPDELLAAGAIDAEHLRITRELGLKSAMIVPLKIEDKVFGAITIVSAESARRYSEEDLEFAKELARRAALAVDNARHRHAALAAQRAAEAANEAKTQFLAVMSHELRTPLNAIGGYAELLLMGLRGTVTAEQQADLERIQRSQRNLLSLINDILNYAKLEAGHVEFSLRPVQLRPVIEELEPLISPQLGLKNISYVFDACDDSFAAHADPEKLRQILLNLISNAVKFTEPGGRISVECVGDDKTVRITVRDTGIGIPEDKLASIFEPFIQLERKLTSNHDGTGLGLAISRDLARGMGGDLTATSSIGEGSAFEITLPAASL
jgi:signal transduction histidine kinase/PAS domain-containing protein